MYVVTGNRQNDVTELQYTRFLIDTHKIHVEYVLLSTFLNVSLAWHVIVHSINSCSVVQ